jgi:chemotaxis protein histidine kinase CheA
MNWKKANDQQRVRRLGSEQATEFGDVIDRARHAAIIQTLHIQSRKPKSGAAKTTRKQKGSTSETSSIEKGKAGTDEERRTPRNSTHQQTTPEVGSVDDYCQFLLNIAAAQGRTAAYERAIDDLRRSDERIALGEMPRPLQKLLKGVMTIRLRASAS